MIVLFKNPGLIDMRVVSMMGVNAKENDSAIGYFGTGLKYSIATLLRNGASVALARGFELYSFSVKQEIIRGKEFYSVMMKGPSGEAQALGFTTELGKNWTFREAYRELYCNAKDEGGSSELLSDIGFADIAYNLAENTTQIFVEHANMTKTHMTRGAFIIDEDRKPDESSSILELYSNVPPGIFYKGIRVNDPNEAFMFAYNFIDKRDLTEDRTLLSWYRAVQDICNFIQHDVEDKHKIARTLTTKCLERSYMQFPSSLQPSEAFMGAMELAIKQNYKETSEDLKRFYYRNKPLKERYATCELDSSFEEQFIEAQEVLERNGFRLSKYEIVIVASLENGILSRIETKFDTLLISKEAFDRGYLLEAMLQAYMEAENYENNKTPAESCISEMVRLIKRLEKRNARTEK